MDENPKQVGFFTNGFTHSMVLGNDWQKGPGRNYDWIINNKKINVTKSL